MLNRVWSWVRSPKGIRIRDVLVAAVLAALAPQEAHNTALGLLPSGSLSVGVAIASGVVLLVRRQFPRATVVACAVAFMLVGVNFSLMFAAYSMANQLGNRRSTWWVAGGAAAVSLVPWGPGGVRSILLPTDPAGMSVFFLIDVTLIGFPVLIGLWRAQRRELIAGLRERADQAELERDLRAANAVTEERTRIARELHDVVAHRVSLINVHAGAMTVSATGELAEFAEHIRRNSATAMNEMRELMSVLRQGDSADADSVPLHPQPTLEGVRELVEQAVRDGQRVSADLPDQPPELPGGTARAIYWLVRESLVNTAKHAPGAEIQVALIDRDDEVDVRVSNTAGVPEALRAAPPPRSGFGLLGMRERVLLSGGTLSVGPTSEGGFLVSAGFPKESR
ncbi:MAG TPA: histidine kinase [Pseudonocardiaceae bacterium]